MAAAEYPSDIIDTRDNISIIDIRDTTDVFHPVPFRRAIKRPAQRKTKANNDHPSRPAPFPTSLTPAAPSKSSTPATPLAYFTPRPSASSTSSMPSISATGPTSGHYSEDWQMGNAGVEAAAAAAGGAAEYGPGAAAEAAAGTAAGLRPPRPSNWGLMTRGQKKNWKQREGRSR